MLIQKYKDIFDFPDKWKWKYYSGLYFSFDPFDSEEAAGNFIREYFQTGGKENVLLPKRFTDKFRNIHSVSTFFLGILLKSLFNLHKLNELKPDFSYLWFIACLYHDYGYYIEKNKNKYSPQKCNLAKIIKRLEIKHNLLESNYHSLFTSSTIEKYYSYCQKERKVINHGIVGGLLLYDKLKKNFEETRQKALYQDPHLKNEDFTYNGLHWASSHEEYYNSVASPIVNHNIWFALKKKDKEKYKKYKLEELIIDNSNQRISCDAEPFLFLLLLADTIEPIKAFFQLKYSCILRKVNIENSDDRKITITVIDDCLEYQNWFNTIINLKYWLQVSVKKRKNKIEIKIE